MNNPKYIGDGVYCHIDSRGLVLTTGHHEPDKADNVIVLEPEILANLEKYVHGLRSTLEKQS